MVIRRHVTPTYSAYGRETYKNPKTLFCNGKFMQTRWGPVSRRVSHGHERDLPLTQHYTPGRAKPVPASYVKGAAQGAGGFNTELDIFKKRATAFARGNPAYRIEL